MKRIYLLPAILLILWGCNKENPEVACGDFSSFTVTQEASVLEFSFNDQLNIGSYEVSYQNVSSTINPFNGSRFIISGPNQGLNTIEQKLSELNITQGETYHFFIRSSACENGEEASWEGPVLVEIKAYCEEPYDLGTSIFPAGRGFHWETYNNHTDPSYFEVEYGLQGFILGTGTTVNTNSERTTDIRMKKDNAYDFYVRTYCEGNIGWSAWVGPVSYFAEKDQNLCTTPSNVIVQIEKNFFGEPVGANFEWDRNGEYNFEYTIVLQGNSPESGQLHSGNSGWPTFLLTQNTDYDFYVRAVCIDDTRTPWLGPKWVNIGD